MSTSSPQGQVTEASRRLIAGGVDTHQLTHHAAVLDEHLREIADQQFAATEAGYRDLLDWMAGFGLISKVGVEMGRTSRNVSRE